MVHANFRSLTVAARLNLPVQTKWKVLVTNHKLKMLSLTCFNYRFTLAWYKMLFFLLLISLLTSLGIWQIHRGQEKERIIYQTKQQLAKSAINWLPEQKLPKQFERITIKGSFVNKILLLDNQHQDHQFGYNVLTPFELSNKKIVLVDRGWVLGDRSRIKWPSIEIPTDPLVVRGVAYYPSKQWLLGPGIEKKNNNLAIVEVLNASMIGQFLHKSVYPFIIRLDKEEPYGFLRQWPIVSMDPKRHYGYAFQWLAMALSLLIYVVVIHVKKLECK